MGFGYVAHVAMELEKTAATDIQVVGEGVVVMRFVQIARHGRRVLCRR
jgi:hypothetical protein